MKTRLQGGSRLSRTEFQVVHPEDLEFLTHVVQGFLIYVHQRQSSASVKLRFRCLLSVILRVFCLKDSMEDQASSKKRRHDDEDAEDAKAQGKRANVQSKDDLDRYTIGWVCALSIEQTAARAMLDEEFQDFHIRKAANDTNTYTLGSIGRHMIVIACLPKGQLGVVRASKVATSMTSTFRNIKFVLMVGIGGGVPSGPNNVRLGDVVVSTPTGEYPGVVQWDFGKTTDGKFERTGSLNNPPTLLLTALAKMESDHELDGSKIQENLDIMFKKRPNLKDKYGRSEKLEDVLFSASYNHVNHPSNHNLTQSSGGVQGSPQGGTGCLYCDHSKATKREVGEPAVHYGLIASGSQVIKDAAYRDEINKNLDGNTLCIEMEAAGLMDDFPCLVIRGICDYADSHKNDAWQKHAAAVAAALTKELLQKVPPVEVDGQRTVVETLAQELRENMTDIHFTALATKNELAKLGAQAQRDEIEVILEWLTPIEHGIQQSDCLRRRQPGTGEWFLTSTEYLTWLSAETESDHQAFYCPGIPGGGKTIIMSAVINDISKRFVSPGTVGIAYIYCNFQRKEDQTLECFLSSLIKQLARSLGVIPDGLVRLHKDNKRAGTVPSAQELFDVLCLICDSYSTLFFLIDALDECQADSCSALISALLSLLARRLTVVKIFATSRFVPEIEKRFDKALKLEIKATNEDIHRYIQHRLPQIPVRLTETPGLQDRITGEISNVVDGMFLLAQLYLEALKDATSVREIISALGSFKHKGVDKVGNKCQLSHVYDEAYRDAMKRIQGQTPNRRDLGTRVVSWITHASRPLTVLELRHALAVDTNQNEVDYENIRDVDVVLSVCAGLVTIEDESMIIRLVHYTAQEFFQRASETYFPGYHAIMASICVKYVCIVYHSPGYRDRFNLWDKSSSYPFLSYASHGWGYHTVQGCCLCKDVETFLLHHEDIMQSLSSFKTLSTLTSSSKKFPESGLGWAAFYGIDEAVDVFRQKRRVVNATDSSGMTPMFYAAIEGKITFMRLLFKFGADLSHKSQHDLLHLAARLGNSDVVGLLLEQGADADRQDSDQRTPLITAVVSNQLSAARKLLLEGAPIETPGRGGRTALHEAAVFDRVDIAEVLLQFGAQVESHDDKGQTPLGIAARSGSEALASLLLAHGGLINAGSQFDKSPLLLARQDWMIQLLIAKGGPIHPKACVDHANALYIASSIGNISKVKQLIATGLSEGTLRGTHLEIALLMAMRYQRANIVNIIVQESTKVDSLHHFALIFAIETGHLDIAARLINRFGSNFAENQVEFPTQRSALSSALQHGYTDVAKLLVKKDIGLNSIQGHEGQHALRRALNHSDFDVARLLIKVGVHLQDVPNSLYQKLLNSALNQGYPDVAMFLIGEGEQSFGESALNVAIERGYLDVVELLVNRGEVNDMQRHSYQTVLFEAIDKGYIDASKALFKSCTEIGALGAPTRKTFLFRAVSHGSAEFARFLIENGASIDGSQGPGKRTVLINAVVNNLLDVAKLLIEKGAEVNGVQEPGGRTPLFATVERATRKVSNADEYLETASLMIESGAELDGVQGPAGQMILFKAAMGGDNGGNMTKLLIDAGINIKAQDENGQTALFQSTATSARLLIEKGVNVRTRDRLGRTALHEQCRRWPIASSASTVRVVLMLLQSGADVNATDNNGLNPLCFACEVEASASNFRRDLWKFHSFKIDKRFVDVVLCLINAGSALPNDRTMARQVMDGLCLEMSTLTNPGAFEEATQRFKTLEKNVSGSCVLIPVSSGPS
ncbi:ankyrin repeat protein [Colletotrichum asianum]|uniref:Ankyrin repeat protein n=1 Tax=Colletotrichum asianum TaxID=702518 RepID=A0A8H3ZGB9_9PEZI|nr:ankyrin repeat protein [Colletotrichum asianum]